MSLFLSALFDTTADYSCTSTEEWMSPSEWSVDRYGLLLTEGTLAASLGLQFLQLLSFFLLLLLESKIFLQSEESLAYLSPPLSFSRSITYIIHIGVLLLGLLERLELTTCSIDKDQLVSSACRSMDLNIPWRPDILFRIKERKEKMASEEKQKRCDIEKSFSNSAARSVFAARVGVAKLFHVNPSNELNPIILHSILFPCGEYAVAWREQGKDPFVLIHTKAEDTIPKLYLWQLL